MNKKFYATLNMTGKLSYTNNYLWGTVLRVSTTDDFGNWINYDICVFKKNQKIIDDAKLENGSIVNVSAKPIKPKENITKISYELIEIKNLNISQHNTTIDNDKTLKDQQPQNNAVEQQNDVPWDLDL